MLDSFKDVRRINSLLLAIFVASLWYASFSSGLAMDIVLSTNIDIKL
jgi:hypothetical protein